MRRDSPLFVWKAARGSEGGHRRFGAFGPPQAIQDKFIVEVSTADFVEAWRSHGTLQRQAGEKFLSIVERIERMLRELETISVPYFTRVWHAKTRKASK